MRTFAISLIDATESERVEDVLSFVGEDGSGAFGILAGRHPLLTLLSQGLCRYRTAAGGWRYIALPGGVLSFRDGLLTIATRRYLRDDDLERIGRRLSDEIAHEEEGRAEITGLFRNVEHQLMRRMIDLDSAVEQCWC